MSEIGNTGLLKSTDFIPSSPVSVVSSNKGNNSATALRKLFDEFSLAETELQKQTSGNLNNPGKVAALTQRLKIIIEDQKSRIEVASKVRSVEFTQAMSILEVSSDSFQKSLSGLTGNRA
jgi:hypothetical protein